MAVIAAPTEQSEYDGSPVRTALSVEDQIQMQALQRKLGGHAESVSDSLKS